MERSSFIPKTTVSGTIFGISAAFAKLSRIRGQVTHALLTRAPLYSPTRRRDFSFDLHVLCTPPAFILSQDQTLQLNPEIHTDLFFKRRPAHQSRYLVFKEQGLEFRPDSVAAPGVPAIEFCNLESPKRYCLENRKSTLFLLSYKKSSFDLPPESPGRWPRAPESDERGMDVGPGPRSSMLRSSRAQRSNTLYIRPSPISSRKRGSDFDL